MESSASDNTTTVGVAVFFDVFDSVFVHFLFDCDPLAESLLRLLRAEEGELSTAMASVVGVVLAVAVGAFSTVSTVTLLAVDVDGVSAVVAMTVATSDAVDTTEFVSGCFLNMLRISRVPSDALLVL